MEFRLLRYFVAVAEELHFARAAERLGVEQSPVSRAMRNLEATLGVQLFDRSAHQTRLTWAGQVFLGECRRVLATVEQAVSAAKAAAQGYQGYLRIAICDSLAQPHIATLLARSREQEPELEIRVFELPFAQQLKGLHNDLLDIGFALSDAVTEGLVAEPVWTDPLSVIVPGMRDHVEAHWQTWLAHASPNSLSVPPLGREDLSLDLHVRALEHCVAQVSGQVQLVAHSAGCITVAHWAEQSQLTARVQSAFLAAPPDLDAPLPEGYPQPAELGSGGWLQVPRIRLPFPTWVGLSDNDPLGRLDDIERLAQDWGAQTLRLGAVGHLNPQFGFGPWPAVLDILERLRAHQG